MTRSGHAGFATWSALIEMIMLPYKRFKATVVAFLALAVVSCSSKDGDPCALDLESHRKSVDDEFATFDAPLTSEQKAVFAGLDYYAGDSSFCIAAEFTRTVDTEIFDMPTFDEASLPFQEYGTFTFEIGGETQTLTGYQRMDLPEDSRQWALIPFKDATNGRDTYGGGRYLHINLPIQSHTSIDFNRAFNPWCAYDPGYVCALPPAKNWLRVSIDAGEKSFKGKLPEAT